MRALFATLVVAASLAFADIAPLPESFPNEAARKATDAPPPTPVPQHPMGIEKAGVGSGVIQGGWEYVYACYALAVIGVLGYGASLFVRRPKEQTS